jgi:hypothetical protein
MLSRIASVAGVALAVGAAHAQIVFQDAQFVVEDWDHQILMSQGTVELGPFTQELVGGNPGAFQRGRHLTDGPFASIYDGHFYLPGVYIPTVQGPIESVDIAYDWIDLDEGAVQHGLAVFQGGQAYIRFVDSAGPYQDWQSLSLSGVTDDDPLWQRVTAGGIFDEGPDFSGAGEDLAFGYYTFNWSLPQGFLIERTWGIDNWSVTLNGTGCPADCDGNGALNVLDFVCFQQAWVAQTPLGDCDGNGLYNVLDFVCFQLLFVDGCP